MWFATVSDAVATDRYVDVSNPAAADRGAGDNSHPYLTLAYGVRQLKVGDRLVIKGGLYRETMDLRNSLLTAPPPDGAAPTVIEGAQGESVTIRGSDVVPNWESVKDGVFVKRSWTVNTQQVFLDGKPLQQIGGENFASQNQWPGRVKGGASDLRDGSFFFDKDNRQLIVKVPLASLQGHTLEASVRPYSLISVGVSNLVVRNLSFSHSNTTALARHGCVTLNGTKLLVDRINVSDCDGIGILLHGDDNEVRDSTSNRCGQLGMHVRGRGVKVVNNETSYNNTRGFNQWWEAGGIKFTGEGGLLDSQVLGHRAFENQGDGIWFDWGNRNNRIDGAIAAYNAGFGIHYEASFEGYITNSYTFGNALRGIYLPHSSRTLVANNLVIGNGMDGIVVIDEKRQDPSGTLDLRPKGNRIVGNILAWNARTELILPDDRADNTSDFNLFMDESDARTAFSMGWASGAKPARRGLKAWREASTQDGHSWNRAMAMPPDLAAALKVRKRDIDWGALLSQADGLEVDLPAELRKDSAETAEGKHRPGPRR